MSSKPVVHLDFETRSQVPFGSSAGAKSVNAVQYAKHPTTEVLLARYAFGDGPVLAWDAWRGEPLPDDLQQAVIDGHVIAAHNAGFEQAIWEHILEPQYLAPPLRMEQMDCTAARAAVCALPRALGDVAIALGLAQQKDAEGQRLMLKMSKPRRPRKTEDPTRVYWHEDEKDFIRLGEYCDDDVLTERAVDNVLPPMTEYQRQQWLRVHRANERGVETDLLFVNNAIAVMDVVADRYRQRFHELTGGLASSATDLNGMRKWLETQGIRVASLDKASIVHLLDEHSDKPHVVELLKLRQEAGKSSVAKLNRFDTLTESDSRMRDNFLFHAANTGRLGGRGAQLQNLPSRGGVEWRSAEECIDMIANTDNPEATLDLIELIHGSLPSVLSSCLRGVIRASEGKQLFVADFSNIEGRVAAWLGGEKWKLDAFRAYDAGTGPDLYTVTAGQILGKRPEDVNKVERNAVGKVSELALGFGGGVGAFVSMANIYHVDMADHWEVIQRSIPGEFIDTARWAWGKFGEKQALQMEMSREAWLASETVKNAWRDRHPGIVRVWSECEKASINALKRPGKWFPIADGKCAIGCTKIAGKPFLVYRLPSGRRLYRADASLKGIEKFGRQTQEIRFMGVNSVTRKWQRQSTYGGDTFQSFVQAIAYDLMDHGWKNVEDAGFEVILSVHDEVGAEGPIHRELSEFEALMNATPEWAAGCPVSSAGYVGQRYRKD